MSGSGEEKRDMEPVILGASDMRTELAGLDDRDSGNTPSSLDFSASGRRLVTRETAGSKSPSLTWAKCRISACQLIRLSTSRPRSGRYADKSLLLRGSGLATRTRHDRGVGAVGRAGQVLFAHPGSACTPGTIVATQTGNSNKPEVAHVRLL